MTGIIRLPWPPSQNTIWRNFKGRTIKSQQYRDWLNTAGWQLQAQRPAKHSGPVSVEIVLGPPSNRRRDLDNHAKAVLDLLVTHRVISDDSLDVVRSITIKRGCGFIGAWIRIEAA
jgi:Holliday junction resolvase RusA-like endonuclease